MLMTKNSPGAQPRIEYIDIAKGIGIILVVLGHCPQVYNPLKQWIYAFHMPLFFIISGLVWNQTSHEANGYFNKKFVLKKFNRLIIPCYIWAVIYVLLNAILDRRFSPMNFLYILYGSQSGFSYAGSFSSLWFLTCMFAADCMFEIIQGITSRRKNREYILFAVSVACALLSLFLPKISGGYPWCLDVAFLATALMIWGYLGRSIIEKTGTKSFGVLIAAMLTNLFLTYTSLTNVKYVSINNVDMAGRYFGNPFLYIVGAIAGSVLILTLSILLTRVKNVSRIISQIGLHTLPILFIHKPIVQLIGKLIGSHVPGIVAVLIELTAALIVSETAYKILIKRLPILFGERRYKTDNLLL